ncbi:DUF2306 domain-containing protein [Sphingomonas sp. BIUV-7]|uniref:DUF2306 domain-containing protein n=1 Tax=Sphingomonas natans TaxID=3063330 RepID=A0ABT8Y6B9_9SPHN|nr:DUF2306 domain-containing protein [Sphingomonas sp. BIUV-7]MDO6413872.1 DUF2306 domain-containing protein [Sphingomonas sp. BIUV-7]
MTSLVAPMPYPTIPTTPRRLIALGAGLVSLLLISAAARHFALGSPTTDIATLWLPLHLATAIPAIPLGAWVLLRRKGDRLHKRLGRLWAVLMMLAALTSFGLTGMLGHLGPIHILSLMVVIGVPRAIRSARRGRIAGHVRGMTIVYGSTVLAGLFAFLPGLMLGLWLFG